jgi:hypothetical protein
MNGSKDRIPREFKKNIDMDFVAWRLDCCTKSFLMKLGNNPSFGQRIRIVAKDCLENYSQSWGCNELLIITVSIEMF